MAHDRRAQAQEERLRPGRRGDAGQRGGGHDVDGAEDGTEAVHR